jgi:putative ABC transport system permease protein
MLVKILENVNMATTALFSNKLRSLLTMLGITIGVASVVLLMSVGQALEDFVLSEFSSFGSDLVFVFGRADNAVGDTLNAEDFEIFSSMNEEQLRELQNPSNVPDASVVAADIAVGDPVEYNGEAYEPQVVGITPNYVEAYNFTIGVGEPLTWDHQETSARVAVIGTDVVEEVFGGQYPVGEIIRIGDVNFEVIGVWGEIDSFTNPTVNDIVVLPLSTVQRRLIGEREPNGEYPVTSITVKARNSTVVDDVVEQVRLTLRDVNDLDADEQDDFVVFSQNQFLDTLDTITSLLTVFLATIAGISLLVGGIGVMNIMLVTVTERTREIGVRKAMGAQRLDILTQFLVESVTMAITGGAIGTVIAIVLSVIATLAISGLSITVSVFSILLATFISTLVGVVFGVYPAIRAAAMQPIDALRHE